MTNDKNQMTNKFPHQNGVEARGGVFWCGNKSKNDKSKKKFPDLDLPAGRQGLKDFFACPSVRRGFCHWDFGFINKKIGLFSLFLFTILIMVSSSFSSATENQTIYSPNSNKPLSITFVASDEMSSAIKNISCRILDLNDNVVAIVGTAETKALGEGFFGWNGKKADGTTVPDGSYFMQISGFDQAGNPTYQSRPLKIDSSGPIIQSAIFSPQTMTSAQTQQKVTVTLNESAQVFIKMKNKATGAQEVFLAQGLATGAPVTGAPVSAVYTWDYSNTLLPSLKDGLYDAEIVAQDSAGNTSEAYTVRSIIVDRTAPVVFGQIAQPYVLSNIGTNPYTTTVTYSLSEANDSIANKQSSDSVNVTIKVINENSGAVIGEYSQLASLSGENQFKWDGSSSSIGAGTYQFKIIAEDKYGNTASAYASCVKNGIAPIISSPSSGQTVSGTAIIKGTAMDPDWTNDKQFKSYRLYYAAGEQTASTMPEKWPTVWKTDFVEVPDFNRGASQDKFTGARPLQSDGTLGYLYTNGLSDGTYTLLLVVEEEGGMVMSAVKKITVDNQSTNTTNYPFIQLGQLSSTVSFKSDDSVKLPISFLNSVAPANVHVEIVKSASSEVVYYKKFPNVAGAPFTGQPNISGLGYFVWQDADKTWHIQWSTDGFNHTFTGNIVAMGGNFTNLTSGSSGVKQVSTGFLSWNTNSAAGFTFKLDSSVKQLMITPKIDEDPANPQIYASNIYLGSTKYTVDYLPIMVDVSNNCLSSLTSLGSNTASGGYNPSASGCEWNGKLDTGAYADSGDYIVRVRAEGIDGIGLSTAEARVKVATPFEVTNIETQNSTFSTLGAPDRVTVSYNVSKDSNVSAYVYDQNRTLVSTLFEDEKVLGSMSSTNKNSFSWRGNYPDSTSGTILTSGSYTIKMVVAAVDGTASETKEISGITIEKTYKNDNYAKLDPIGEGETYNGSRIQLTEGESPFYFTAKGVGLYHPPRDFTYQLSAGGLQRFKTYPYVPFAGLMHRGFKQVDVKFKIILAVHGYYEKKEYGWNGNAASWFNRQSVDFEDEINGVYSFRDEKPPFIAERYYKASDWCPQGETKIGKIESVVIRKIEVYAGGNNRFKMDEHVLLIGSGSDEVIGKGIFKVKLESEKVNDSLTNEAYNMAALLEQIANSVTSEAIKLSPEEREKFGSHIMQTSEEYNNKNLKAVVAFGLEDEIKYSRLTNRFIPWYGFVNKNHPLNINFDSYLVDINRGLGFPGKKFFDDPTAQPDVAFDFTADQITGEVAGKSWEGKLEWLRQHAEEANLKNYSDALGSTSGYDSYLSDEIQPHFIPITQPAGGSMVNTGGMNYSARTELTLYPAADSKRGEAQTPFTFSWPNPDAGIASWETTYGLNGANYRSLIGKGTISKPEKAQDWDSYGTLSNKCFYELDQNEINQHKNNLISSGTFSGRTIYHRDRSKSDWTSSLTLGQLLPAPSYPVENHHYAISSLEDNLSVTLSNNGVNGNACAEDLRQPLNWTTENDSTLLKYGGVIKSKFENFNPAGFMSKRDYLISSKYDFSNDYTSPSALQYSFLTQDPYLRISGTKVDNPNLDINSWEISVYDKTNQANDDLKAVDSKLFSAKHTDDKFTLALDPYAKEKRFVEITGTVSGPYELMYFDGDKWVSIYRSNIQRSGRLAWWDVNRLNGKYTVLLKTGSYISTQDVYVGTLVKRGETKDVYSAYCCAQLSFKANSFRDSKGIPIDQMATVTPVTMTEIKVRNRPIIMTHGPIVEIKPSPYNFLINSAVDNRPTLRFIYSLDDLTTLGYWSGDQSQIKAGDRISGINLNIHQITSNGDLQLVANNNQVVEINGGEKQYVFYAPLDHFSTYTLVDGKFKLSAPIVYADRYITNKDSVTIYGSAEPDSELEIKISTSPLTFKEDGTPDLSGAATFTSGSADFRGNYRINKVKLLQEGENYIYVLANPKGNTTVKTIGDVEIVKDTVPPTATATANLAAFSPNEDGKWDNLDYTLSTNEKGYLSFIVLGTKGEDILNQTVSVEANGEIKFVWGKNGFNLYRRQKSGAWQLYNTFYAAQKYADGYYSYTAFAIDEAGNISNNVSGSTLLDTTPPTISGLTADPNPFTPNGDGIKDTTKISYKLSEPAYSTINIFNEENVLFRRYAKAAQPGANSWDWDGRGARNELLGGNYNYYLQAEDAVGNTGTSETKAITVDHIPSLIAYAYADPDPFSPVKGDATEIKYYLGRDNCQVQAYIVGDGGNSIKNLVFGETQNKGTHTAKWSGDYLPGYKGVLCSKDTSKVGDGSYEFKIIAKDAAGGQPAEVVNTVLVDNTPPTIFCYPVAVDYAAKKASIKYAIPEPASVEVGVYDLDGKLVEKTYSGFKTAGTYIVDYKNVSETKQQYFKITAEDKAKNNSEKTTEIFALSAVIDLAAAITLTPSAITPNGDGHTDFMRINYKISGGAPEYKVTLKILDSTNATVKTIVDDETQTSGINTYYWKGEKNDNSYIKTDGMYQYQLEAEDKLGDTITNTGEFLAVVSKPTVSIAVTPDIFSPNGDGSADTTLFTYSVNYPTQWITGEAEVKIDVMTTTGEAVFTKSFKHSSGTYNYTWDGLLTNNSELKTNNYCVPDGTYYIYINATDAQGTPAITQGAILTVDYTKPEPTDFSVLPLYAKAGTRVGVNLSFPEQLISTPEVTFKLSDGVEKKPDFLTAVGSDYAYSYTVLPSDADGAVTVTCEARDLALNLISKTASFTIDKVKPEISSYTISSDPNPATTEEVKVRFTSSETLEGIPVVYVTQKNGSALLAQTAKVSGNIYESKYRVYAGYDGWAEAKIDFKDLALNSNTKKVSFEVDTIAPTFFNVSSDPLFVRAGIPANITFDSSEKLAYDPDVYINNNAAQKSGALVSLSSGAQSYTYMYTVSNSDLNGLATIEITGEDFAGNKATLSTDKVAESFRIDIISPVVVSYEASAGDVLIANPSPFSPNLDKVVDTVDLYYTLSEPGYVTVSVHKIDDSKTTYSSADFTALNRVNTLITNQWLSGNQTIQWNGKVVENLALCDTDGNSYADSGKYAFIVYVYDKAGNITEKKYGGTVWVQDMILKVAPPEQWEITANNIQGNPHPRIFSPNVYSNTTMYFRVNRGAYPKNWEHPEWISALAVDDNISWESVTIPGNECGTYTSKVYSASGTLVRTIDKDKIIKSSVMTAVLWDGKNDAGSFVPDGRYKIMVNVTDFTGVAAKEGNPFERWVIIDRTPPTLEGLSVTNPYISPASTQSTATTETTIKYNLSDNFSSLTSEANQVVTDLNAYQNSSSVMQLQYITKEVTSVLSAQSYLWDGHIPASSSTYVGDAGKSIYKDGTYTYRVTATDLAGNIATTEASDLVVDTIKPTGWIVIDSISDPGPTYTTDNAVNIFWSSADTTSGIDKMCISNYSASSAWNTYSNPTTGWSLTSGDGEKEVYIRLKDKAGNSADFSDKIILDTSDPYFSTGPTVDTSHTPLNSWSTHVDPYISFKEADTTSGVASCGVILDGTEDPLTSPYSPLHKGLNDGTHEVQIKIYDNAGRSFTSGKYKFMIDTKAPNAPSVTMTGSQTVNWTNLNTPIFTWSDPGDSGGSGVSSYEGFIDNVSKGTVVSGWTPTLSDGAHSVYIRAYDGVGYYNDSSTFNFNIDSVKPVISGVTATPNPFNPYKDINTRITFEAYDAAPSSGFGVSNITAKIKFGSTDIKTLSVVSDGGNIYHADWDGMNSSNDYVNEGKYTLEINAADGAGNPSITKTATVELADDQRITNSSIDSTDPYLQISGSALSLKWNDGYTDAGSFLAKAEGGEFNDWYDNVRDRCYAGNSFTVDHSQTLTISLKSSGGYGGDGAGNNCFYKIKIGDNPTNYNPSTEYNDSTNDLSGAYWAYPGGLDKTVTFTISPGKYYFITRVIIGKRASADISMSANISDRKFYQYSSSSSDLGKNWEGATGPTQIDTVEAGSVYANYFGAVGENVYKILTAFYNVSDYQGVFVKKGVINSDKITSIAVNIGSGSTFEGVAFNVPIKQNVTLNTYKSGSTATAYYYMLWDNNPIKVPTAKNLWTATAENQTKVINLDAGTYWLWVSGNGSSGSTQIELRATYRDDSCFTWATTSAQLTHLPAKASNPAICKDSSNNLYASWEDYRDGNKEIYFQKIPSNFAPLKGSVTASSVKTGKVGNVANQAASIPEIISPKGGATVKTIRPEFKWKGIIGAVDYQISLGKNSLLSVPDRKFTKTFSAAEASPADGSVPSFAYSIHEFDEGLDRGNWQWQVLANPGATNEAKSIVESFAIDPPLTITGITNYPNPFNPNSEKTKIRYRLGADADEVTIRIYDITGSLVAELDGTTRGEGSSIWDKYNDVEWDGRNGRGDLVLNGIYPFEVVARSGSSSVSGRGKIAVLK